MNDRIRAWSLSWGVVYRPTKRPLLSYLVEDRLGWSMSQSQARSCRKLHLPCPRPGPGPHLERPALASPALASVGTSTKGPGQSVASTAAVQTPAVSLPTIWRFIWPRQPSFFPALEVQAIMHLPAKEPNLVPSTPSEVLGDTARVGRLVKQAYLLLK